MTAARGDASDAPCWNNDLTELDPIISDGGRRHSALATPLRDVMFLPGVIAPASVRYGALLARLPDVHPLLKDLELYASDAPPSGYSISMEVLGVARVADEAGWERFHLYGHSAGGAVALAYAAEHPERVLTLAVDEPAYDFTEAMRPDMAEFDPVASLPEADRMPAFMKLQVSPAVEVSPPEGPRPEWMARRPKGVEAFLAALDPHQRLEDHYASFRSPVLFTWGSLTHPRWDAMRDRLARLFPDFTAHRFEGLHHLNTSHQAQPDRVAELLRQLWLRGGP